LLLPAPPINAVLSRIVAGVLVLPSVCHRTATSVGAVPVSPVQFRQRARPNLRRCVNWRCRFPRSCATRWHGCLSAMRRPGGTAPDPPVRVGERRRVAGVPVVSARGAGRVAAGDPHTQEGRGTMGKQRDDGSCEAVGLRGEAAWRCPDEAPTSTAGRCARRVTAPGVVRSTTRSPVVRHAGDRPPRFPSTGEGVGGARTSIDGAARATGGTYPP
jgi:hypothetical protein